MLRSSSLRSSLRLLRATTLIGLLPLIACDKPAAKSADKADKSANSIDKPAEPKPAAPKPAEPKPAAPKPADGKPGNQLTLGAAKLIPKAAPTEYIELLADGTVNFEGVASGVKITADGKITKPDGTISAEVGIDGALTIDGKASGIVLSDTGFTLHAIHHGQSVTVTFHDDGRVEMVPPAGPDLEMTAEGCAGPVARTCGLLLAMYVMTAGDADRSAAAAAPAPAATTP